MRKILIIGDSSVLPREETSFFDTYYFKLKRFFDNTNTDIELNGKRSLTSREIYFNIEDFLLYDYKPSIVIFHFGIVDCFPRPYPKKLYSLLKCFGLNNALDNFLKSIKLYYKIANLMNFTLVSEKQFYLYSKNILKKTIELGAELIFLIGIVRASKISARVSKANKKIARYNEIFKTLAQEFKGKVVFVDMYNTDEELTIWDGYHFSAKGMDFIFNEIIKHLKLYKYV